MFTAGREPASCTCSGFATRAGNPCYCHTPFPFLMFVFTVDVPYLHHRSDCTRGDAVNGTSLDGVSIRSDIDKSGA